jgi:hypothetical protein
MFQQWSNRPRERASDCYGEGDEIGPCFWRVIIDAKRSSSKLTQGEVVFLGSIVRELARDWLEFLDT